MAQETITINGQPYILAPLQCKHLRQITDIIKERRANPQQVSSPDLMLWMQFVIISLKRGNEGFVEDTAWELTLPEYEEAWGKLMGISSIRFTTASTSGESQPTTAVM